MVRILLPVDPQHSARLAVCADICADLGKRLISPGDARFYL